MPRFRHLLLAALVGAFALGCSAAFADPPLPPLVPWLDPPSTVAQANGGLPIRRGSVMRFAACGYEYSFIDYIQTNRPDAGEGIGQMLIAKMMWLREFKDKPCSAISAFDPTSAELTDEFKAQHIPFETDIWQAILTKFAGRDCAEAFTSITSQTDGTIQIEINISPACLKAEVNAMASRLRANITYDKDKKAIYRSQVGTNGRPCVTDLLDGLTVRGDADVGIRDMTRLFYLDGDMVGGKFVEGSRNIFDPSTRAYVRDSLLTLHGGLGADGFSPLDCGNPDVNTPTPQEVLDEHNFLNQTTHELGDAAGWFAKRFLVLAAVLVFPAELAAAVLGSLGEGAAAADAASVAAAGTLSVGAITWESGVVDFTIPETENHRLMIESSKYLKNQIVINELPHHPQIGVLRFQQESVKAWLMSYMSGIMRKDFAEYNARPYQRYSLNALLNLADFAEDQAVRTAAAMTLEYTMAKFAVGSRDGLRIVPYRRRVDNMARNPSMAEIAGEGTDFSILLMQYYAGLSQHLPVWVTQVDDGPHLLPHDATRQRGLPHNNAVLMIYPASSTFAPSDAILDLAIDKSATYFQRVHHAGIEIYANFPGFTLSGGGIITPPSRQLLLNSQVVGGNKDLGFGGQISDDKGGPGTGVPTSLIFDHLPRQDGLKIVAVDRLAQMGFEGAVNDMGDSGRTFDRNACVWFGFACGFNYQDYIFGPCFGPGLADAPKQWSFLNTAKCDNFAESTTTTFIARYLLNCDGDHDCAKDRQFGFFEAVDASKNPTDAAFDAFRSMVVNSNRNVFPDNDTSSDAIDKEGTYTTFGGASIRFKIAGDASRVTRIFGSVNVPDISDWPFLDGDVLNSKGDGIIRFKNPRTMQSIVWDFSDATNPKRATSP